MDWRPGITIDRLRVRSDLRRRVRGFFEARGVEEVDTPLLGRHTVTEPAIDSIRTTGGFEGYLQTSPEYFMKRLLAGGSGPIYQMGPVFRAGESGSRHNPEFTLLEWYRPGFSMSALMEEVAALVSDLLVVGRPIVMEYRQLLREHGGVDPWVDSDDRIRGRAAAVSGLASCDLSRREALDLLMTHEVEPALACVEAVFVRGFPPEQAALAVVGQQGGLDVAQRFELYVHGIELCNGYRELTDAGEQQARFERDNQRRRAEGKVEMTPDPGLLAALSAGLPDCSGVALGLDRLLMLYTGAEHIDAVLPFSSERL